MRTNDALQTRPKRQSRRRPKTVGEVRDLAREYAVEAIETLARICKSGRSEAARVSAAIALLDRGHGKPVQTINANVKRTLIDMTDEELMVIAAGNDEEIDPGPTRMHS